MVVSDERELLFQSLEARRHGRAKRQQCGLCVLLVAVLFLIPTDRVKRDRILGVVKVNEERGAASSIATTYELVVSHCENL